MLRSFLQALNAFERRFRNGNDGAIAVEYAFILPVFLAMTIGGFEVGRMYMVNATLEGAVTKSTRIAMTGALPDTYETRDQYISDVVVDLLNSSGVEEGINVSMKVYDSFENIGEEEPYVDSNGNDFYDDGECFTDVNGSGLWDADMGSSGTGGEENIMVMTVDVDLPYMTGYFGKILSGKDSVTLSATTTIRNEPFGGVAWEPSDNVICGT